MSGTAYGIERRSIGFIIRSSHDRRKFDKKYGPGSADKFHFLRKNGASGREIGKEFGFSRQSASDWDRKMNPGRPKPVVTRTPNLRSDVTLAKILELIRDGNTRNEIIAAFHCSESTLYDRLKGSGIVLPKSKNQNNARTDLTRGRLRRCSAGSKTIAEMAAKLKAAPVTVIRWCHYWNVEMPEARRRRERQKQREEARRLAILGWSPRRIGLELEVGETTVKSYLNASRPEEFAPHPESASP